MTETRPIRIAFASDQAIFRRGLANLILSLKGFQLVGEAQSAEDAIQLSEMIRPEIFLLDLKALQENGKAVAAVLHRRWPEMRVILMIDHHVENEMACESDEDSHYCFSKDITEEEFIAALQKIGHDLQPERSSLPEGVIQTPVQVEYHHVDESSASTKRTSALQKHNDLMTRELITAGKIQSDILPEKPPQIAGWDISAKLVSARETSGDFYDFIPLVNENWGIVIADVTDKGMGAALFMALSSTLIRTYAVRYPSLPALAMDVVNDRILSDTRGSMFVTVFYGVLEPHTGRLRYVNAGHPPAYLLSTLKGKPVDRLRPTGMALGVMENAHWQQKIARFASGDVMLLYTDGVTEAQNANGQFFGDQRLQDVLRQTRSVCSAHDIHEAVLSAVHAFVGDTPGQDDIALIVIKKIK